MKLTGEQAKQFLASIPNYQNLKVISGGADALQQALGQSGIAARQQMYNDLLAEEERKKKEKEGPGGILGLGLGIVKGVADPFIRAAKFGGELGNFIASESRDDQNYTPIFFDAEKDLAQEGLKTLLSAGAFAVPGGGSTVLGGVTRGAGGAALSSAANQLDFDAENLGFDLKQTAFDIGTGGALGGGLSKLGKGMNARQLKQDQSFLGGIDDNIAKQANSLKAQGLTDDVIGKNLGTASGSTNARLNYITQNLGDKEQKKALQTLLRQTPADDPVRGSLETLGRMKGISGVSPMQADDIRTRGATSQVDDLTPKDRLKDYLIEGSPVTDADNFAKLSGNRMERLGKNMQMDTLGLQATGKDFDFYKNTRQLRADVDNMFEILGKRPNQKNLQSLKDNLRTTKKEFIKNSGYSGATIDDFSNRLQTNTRLLGGDDVTRGDVASKFKILAADLLRGGDADKVSRFISGNSRLRPADMDSLRQKIGPFARKAYDKIQRGTARDQDYLMNALDESLKQELSENIPGYLRTNSLFAALGERNPQMAANFNQGQNVSNLGQQNLLSQLTSFAKNRTIGPGLQILGGAPKNLPGNISNLRIPNMYVPGISQAAANPVLQQVAPATLVNTLYNQRNEQPEEGLDPLQVLGMAGQQQAPQMNMRQMGGMSPQMDIGMGDQMDGMNQMGIGQPQMDGMSPQMNMGMGNQMGGMSPQMGMGMPNKMEIFQAALSDTGGDIGEAMKLTEFFMPEQPTAPSGGGLEDATEKQSQFYHAGNSADQALALLESGGASTGKVQKVGSMVQKFFGTSPDTQTEYESNLALARGLAMNALAGASISPSEAARVADAIPELTDEPKVAAQKLRSFSEQMRMFSGVGAPQSNNLVSYYQ